MLPTAMAPGLSPAIPHPKLRPGMAEATFVTGAPEFAAPVPMVQPRPRPSAAQRPAEVVQVAARTRSYPPTALVAPPARPDNLIRLNTVQAIAFIPVPQPGIPAGKKGAVCGEAGIKGQALLPILSKIKACGLEDGVKVTSVGGIPLSTPATIDCPTARALSAWVEQGLKPIVGGMGGGVMQIEVATSYACRPRNNQAGNKISEHGRGAALDVTGIRLANGTVLSVLKGWGTQQQGRILAALHKAACGPFTTVLGPAANSFHRDHFHFDTARGRGPYCH